MQKIADNVYVENELSMCNTGIVVTKEGVVIIDTPMAPVNAKKLAVEVEKFGPIRYVIKSIERQISPPVRVTRSLTDPELEVLALEPVTRQLRNLRDLLPFVGPAKKEEK